MIILKFSNSGKNFTRAVHKSAEKLGDIPRAIQPERGNLSIVFSIDAFYVNNFFRPTDIQHLPSRHCNLNDSKLLECRWRISRWLPIVLENHRDNKNWAVYPPHRVLFSLKLGEDYRSSNCWSCDTFASAKCVLSKNKVNFYSFLKFTPYSLE